MRRIIERVVTVVTTTTWKISWEADPGSDDLPGPNTLGDPAQSAQPDLPVVEGKEAQLKESKTVTNKSTGQQPGNV